VLVFALVGLAGFTLFVFMFIRPIFKIIGACGWNATPCIIVNSSVGRHSGSKGGSTYSIDLVYTYDVAGQKFTGTRYHFLGGSSSGYQWRAAAVKRYPRGKHTTCYVNPRDPSDAVIERGFTPDMWFGLIPLAFVAAVVWGMISSRRATNRPAGNPWKPDILRHGTDFKAVSIEPRELKPAASPSKNFAVFLLVALFWNGIVSVFLVQIGRGLRSSHGDWSGALFNGGQALFMVPFALIGLVLILAACSCFLALFNPSVHLTVSPGAVALGDALSLDWTIRGRASRLARLHISLEGREEATCQNGKNTSTSREVFSKIEIVDTASLPDIASGHARATLARGGMHSLDTGHNKITWTLIVHGEISRWPDVKEEFPLIVLPVRKEASR